MDKKLMGLLGAVSTLATATAALASPSPHPADGLDGALQARSFDDLLAPVPNAGAVLRALDEADAARVAREPEVELAQDYSEYARPRVFRPHHHHHHAQVYVRRRPRIVYHHHHHHHHHHHSVFRY